MRDRNGYIFNLGHGVPPTPEWRISRRWRPPCRISYEQIERGSRIGPKIQRAGAALHVLSARPAVHRPGRPGRRWRQKSRRRSRPGAACRSISISRFASRFAGIAAAPRSSPRSGKKARSILTYLDKEMEHDERADQSASVKWCNCIGAAARRPFCRPPKFAAWARPSASISHSRPTSKPGWRLIRAGSRAIISPPCAKRVSTGPRSGVQDFDPKGAGGGASHSTARANRAGHRVGARGRFCFGQRGFDLRLALSDGANPSSKRWTKSSSWGRTGWRFSVTRMCRG